MTSQRKRRATKRKSNSPSSPPSSNGSSSSEENNSLIVVPSSSSNNSTNEFHDDLIFSKRRTTYGPFITPQLIKKEIGLMKLNGHVNDLDEFVCENSILFGKEINSSRKRSIVSMLQTQEENFKQSQFRQSNKSSISNIIIGSKKRKQTRPVQAPVHSQDSNDIWSIKK